MIDWHVIDGLTPYKEALELMERHVQSTISGTSSEKVILLEHEDVYTSGTGAVAEDLIDANNIPVFATGRGGKYTYHGPGQRIIYPILNLASINRIKDLKKYIADLEQWIISTLQAFDIDAFVAHNRVGIWALDQGTEKKIGAIGVRVKKWVTYHGIAVNIATDLAKFNGIVPCGLKEFGVTSMKNLGKFIELSDFDLILQQRFYNIF
jgi:lipoyl(octanoyl) transferase